MNGNSNNRRNGNGRNGRDHTTVFPPGGGSAFDQITPAMWADMTNMIFHLEESLAKEMLASERRLSTHQIRLRETHGRCRCRLGRIHRSLC